MLEQFGLAGLGNEGAIVLRFAVALALCGVIGFERELANRPAGFRTHMLVGGAAALLVGLADPLAERFSAEVFGASVRVDPVRVMEAVVTGVAFLGAGTIFRERGGRQIEGLTTAASLPLVAAIGVAVGLEKYVVASGVTVLSFVVLRVMRVVETLANRD